jgi:hypothetical protein
VWGPQERNPWLGLVFEAVGAVTGRQVPPLGVPGPFSLSDAGALEALLVDAGLAGVAVRPRAVPQRAASFTDWWERTAALAGPLATILASLPEPAVEAIVARLREATAAYVNPQGLELPGECLIAAGRRI